MKLSNKCDPDFVALYDSWVGSGKNMGLFCIPSQHRAKDILLSIKRQVNNWN